MVESLTSVVLPVHNQEDHIDGVVHSYREGLNSLERPYELVLVPNACTDDSALICRQLAAEAESTLCVELDDGGWGRAVRAGLSEASGTSLCYANSARTTTAMLTLVLAYSMAYPDVVLKVNRRVRDSFVRRLGSLLYNLECRALFDLSTWDINGTPKVFPRKFERLLELSQDGDLIDVELLATCHAAGYPVIEVPILTNERHGGNSTTGWRAALRLYWGAMLLRRSWSYRA